MKKCILPAMALCVLAFACADYHPIVDPTAGLPDVLVANPSFANDVQPILTERCSIGGCHSLATSQGELTLHEDVAYDDLVDVVSTQNPLYRRVRPAKPDSSWLVKLLTAGPGGVDGFARMPLSSTPLTANQIGTIVNWITQGAARN